MYYEKEKYERLIRESVLFDLDQEKERNAYKRESYKMIEYLYGYLMAVNEEKYEPFGCEITDLAIRCMKSFDPSKGIFLHYFNAAWKKEYSHIVREQIHDSKLHGIHISEEDKRMVQTFSKYLSKERTELPTSELYEKIADLSGMDPKKVQRIAELSSISVSGEYIGLDDDQSGSLWDIISDPFSFEKELERADLLKEYLDRIDRGFHQLQERQKPLISDLITIRICPFIEGISIEQYSFISYSIINEWVMKGIVPTQKEIADRYGRTDASISRTIQGFLNKIREDEWPVFM